MNDSANGQPVGDWIAAAGSLAFAAYASKRWHSQLSAQRFNLFDSGALGSIGVVMLLVLGPLLGAVLNRIRGGWLLDSESESDPLLRGGDTQRRLLMATPIGFLVYLANGGGTLIAFLTSLLLFLGELEGWGCYFSMARGPDCTTEPNRFGMFDFLLGRADADFSFDCRWLRDAAAMALRGLVWMLPPGLLWHSLLSQPNSHLASLPCKSTSTHDYLVRQESAPSDAVLTLGAGMLMAVIYESGNHIHLFEPLFQGNEVAELIMGFWIYACFITIALRRSQILKATSQGSIAGTLVSSLYWLLVIFSTSGLALLLVTLPWALAIRLGGPTREHCLAQES